MGCGVIRLIKRREFQSKLADIGLCTDHQAGQLFDKLKNDRQSNGLNYTEFHAGFTQMQGPKGPITYSPGNPSDLFQGTRSVGSKRTIQQPLSVAEFKKGSLGSDQTWRTSTSTTTPCR